MNSEFIDVFFLSISQQLVFVVTFITVSISFIIK